MEGKCCVGELVSNVFEKMGERALFFNGLFWLMAKTKQNEGKVSLRDLASALRVGTSTAKFVVDELEKMGFISFDSCVRSAFGSRSVGNKKPTITICYEKIFQKSPAFDLRSVRVRQPKNVLTLPSAKPAEPKSTPVVEAYFSAYERVYGIRPVRNAKINSLACKLVDELGSEVAAKVAAFYVTHRGSWYVSKRHQLEWCLKDAQALRTEMLSGVQVTSSMARKVDSDNTIDQTIKQFLDLKKEAASTW